MNFPQQLLFFLSLVGAFNGFFLSVYFLSGRFSKTNSSKYLGLLILMITIRVTKSVFLYFSDGLSSYIVHIGIAACAGIGPAAYLFVESIYSEQKSYLPKLIHFLPALAVIVFGELIVPYNTDKALWQIILIAICVQYAIYLGFCWYLAIKKIEIIKYRKLYSLELGALLGSSLILIAYMSTGLFSYISGALTYSLIIYLLLWVLLSNRLKLRKSPTSTIPASLDKEISEKLDDVFNNQQLFMNNSIKLKDIAENIGITPHLLSEYINNKYQQNLNQFINEYRLKEAAHRLRTTDDKIEKIAYDVGFNSPSNFFALFKEKFQKTPSRYRKT